MVADRTPRPTIKTAAAIASSRLRTEQIAIVVPAEDRTVTELGADINAILGEEPHRATLVLVAGPDPGQVYTLGEETILGRDASAQIRIDDAAVSRVHAKILLHDGQYVVMDLGSSNGTMVGGVRVSRHVLVEGDRVQLGSRVVLKFSLLDEAEERLQRQLFESATRDPLTRAFNKKYVTERLAAEVAHARRHDTPLEIVIFDLDRFKQVNDVHGHLVGDAVLRTVADRVHALIRTEDVFGRFGGEEFVLISRGSDAARLAERIRWAIEQLVIPVERGQIGVTVSVGVAKLAEAGADHDGTRLIEVADHRLLRAKRSGRNQVCAHD